MGLEGLVLALTVGLVAGMLAQVVREGGRYGRRGDMATGLAGGLLGAWGLGAIGVYDGGGFGTTLAAFGGAGSSILLLRTMRPGTRSAVSRRILRHRPHHPSMSGRSGPAGRGSVPGP